MDEIRKRIAKRKRERERLARKSRQTVSYLLDDEERYGFDKVSYYEGEPNEKSDHPFFHKETIIFKILASAILVLFVAIVFRNDGEMVQPVKAFIAKSMEEDFQFAAVANWYENQFGTPLALIPGSMKEDNTEGDLPQTEYALPASGRILEEFDQSGQRIGIEIDSGEAVTAMSEGVVRFIGNKEGFGKTVIVQHGDKSESWYGNLENIQVGLYEFVAKGAQIGTSANGEDGTKGMFYFAIKKGDDFVDPVQVIQFE